MAPPLCMLLPGLDGTGELFAPFTAAAPAGFRTRALALPQDRPYEYRELAAWARERLPAESLLLIAESFSGPLAVLLAAECRNIVALVLVATFAAAPLPAALLALPAALRQRPPPALAARIFLTGGDRALAAEVQRVTASVPPAVLAARIASVLRVNVCSEFAQLSQPLLCLRATQDRLILGHCFSKLRALQPRARFVSIAGPHLLLQTRPREAWGAIQAFLDAG